MKTALFFLFCSITLSMLAQNNPYCPCQEEARRQQELELNLQQSYQQVFLYRPQQNVPQAIPVSIPKQEEQMLRINVKPQPQEIPEEVEETEVEDQREEELLEDDLLEEEEEIFIGERREKLKTRKKLFKKRLKKRKRKPKYRGTCPRF